MGRGRDRGAVGLVGDGGLGVVVAGYIYKDPGTIKDFHWVLAFAITKNKT